MTKSKTKGAKAQVKLPSPRQAQRQAVAKVSEEQQARNDSQGVLIDGMPKANNKMTPKQKTKVAQKNMQQLLQEYDGKTPLNDILYPAMFGNPENPMDFDTRTMYLANLWGAEPIKVADFLGKIAMRTAPYLHKRKPVDINVTEKRIEFSFHGTFSADLKASMDKHRQATTDQAIKDREAMEARFEDINDDDEPTSNIPKKTDTGDDQ